MGKGEKVKSSVKLMAHIFFIVIILKSNGIYKGNQQPMGVEHL